MSTPSFLYVLPTICYPQQSLLPEIWSFNGINMLDPALINNTFLLSKPETRTSGIWALGLGIGLDPSSTVPNKFNQKID